MSDRKPVDPAAKALRATARARSHGKAGSDELEALRTEARRLQRNANRKASRLKTLKNVHIGATSHDPRVAAKMIGKYTTKQLIAYNKRLTTFNSRTVSFVAGAEGQPIPTDLFLKYKSAEQAHNRIYDSRMDEFGHLIAPGSGMTIKERDQSFFESGGKRARGRAENSPFVKFDRNPEDIKSVDALNKLIDDYTKKNRQSTFKKTLKAEREELNKMLIAIGDEKMIDRANKLTDNQFDILFHETKFATDVSTKYEIWRSLSAGRKQAWFDSVGETAENDINTAFTWAETLPKTKPDARGKKGKN